MTKQHLDNIVAIRAALVRNDIPGALGAYLRCFGKEDTPENRSEAVRMMVAMQLQRLTRDTLEEAGYARAARVKGQETWVPANWLTEKATAEA